MMCVIVLVLVALPSSVMNASVKKMLEVEKEPMKHSLEENLVTDHIVERSKRSIEEKMDVDHIVEVEEWEPAVLPAPPLGEIVFMSWSQRRKEIYR